VDRSPSALPAGAANSDTTTSSGRPWRDRRDGEKQTENLQKTAAQVTPFQRIPRGCRCDRSARGADDRAAVRFQAEGNNTQVFVRGVGANLDFPNVEPTWRSTSRVWYLSRDGDERAFSIRTTGDSAGSQGRLLAERRWNHRDDAGKPNQFHGQTHCWRSETFGRPRSRYPEISAFPRRPRCAWRLNLCPTTTVSK